MSSESHIFIRENIKQLVAENKNEEVFDALVELSKKVQSKDISNSIIMLSARYENFVKESMLGTVGNEEKDVTLAKLNQAILHLIDGIPDEIFTIEKKTIVEKDGLDKIIDKAIKIMIIVLFGVGVLGMIWSVIFTLFNSKSGYSSSDFIPFIASFMSLITAGVFYKVYSGR